MEDEGHANDFEIYSSKKENIEIKPNEIEEKYLLNLKSNEAVEKQQNELFLYNPDNNSLDVRKMVDDTVYEDVRQL